MVERRSQLTEHEQAGYRRMTLTYPILERARQAVWLVTGSAKADMLARLVAGDLGIPAGRLKARSAVVFADREAYPG